MATSGATAWQTNRATDCRRPPIPSSDTGHTTPCPSVVSSEKTDFVWLILFSEKTPEKYKKRIEEYEIAYSQIKAVYLSGGRQLKAFKDIHYKECIEVLLEYDADKYIITRVDNDDAISKNYIGEIKTIAKCYFPNEDDQTNDTIMHGIEKIWLYFIIQ